MSLLLDALNRAQKNKEHDAKSVVDEDKAINDLDIENSSNSIETVDMEGLDLEEAQAANSEDNSDGLEKSDFRGDEISNESNIEESFDKIESNDDFEFTSSEDVKLIGEDDIRHSSDLDELEAVETNIEPDTESSFGGLSLEAIQDEPQRKESKLANLLDEQLDDNQFIANDDTNLESKVEENVVAEKNTGEADENRETPKIESTILPVDTNESKTNANDSKTHIKTDVISGSSVIKTPADKSTDIKKLKKSYRTKKIRKVIIATSSAITASLTIAFAGYYYYQDQVESLNSIAIGGLESSQYAGRTLTPLGAVPPEDTPLAKAIDQSMDKDIITPDSKVGKVTGIIKGIDNKPTLNSSNQTSKPKVSSKKTIVKKATKVDQRTEKAPKKTSITPPRVNKKIDKTLSKTIVNSTQSNLKQKLKENKLPITSQKQEDPIHPLLVVAFDAFQMGDDITAKEKYIEVLRLDSNNRDALLGLGAVAVRQKQLDLARNYYTRLLKRNQDDSVARGALVGLVGQMDPVKAETELKLLLKKEPGAGYLHFALGNIYALQQRWLDAQNSFFNAYRTDNENADYAYNVAVSLDHLGERKAAARFYQQSIHNSQNKVVSFSTNQVRQRLEVINQSISGIR